MKSTALVILFGLIASQLGCASTSNQVAPATQPCPSNVTPIAADATALPKEALITVFTPKGLPDDVQQTEVEISRDADPTRIAVKVKGTTDAIQGNVWFFCSKIIQLAPGVKVPLSLFTSHLPLDSEVNQGLKTAGVSNAEWTAKEGTRWTGYVVASDQGATFKKQGNGFLLVKGEARMAQSAIGPEEPIKLSNGELILTVSQ